MVEELRNLHAHLSKRVNQIEEILKEYSYKFKLSPICKNCNKRTRFVQENGDQLEYKCSNSKCEDVGKIIFVKKDDVIFRTERLEKIIVDLPKIMESTDKKIAQIEETLKEYSNLMRGLMNIQKDG